MLGNKLFASNMDAVAVAEFVNELEWIQQSGPSPLAKSCKAGGGFRCFMGSMTRELGDGTSPGRHMVRGKVGDLCGKLGLDWILPRPNNLQNPFYI